VQLYQTQLGKWAVRVRARNGEPIGRSPVGYESADEARATMTALFTDMGESPPSIDVT
jgi:uncharacterized protein YegP (UPF0339 family)